MVKKSLVKKPAKKRTSSRGGVKVRLRTNPKLLKRLAQLGLHTNVVDEPALSIFLELQQKHVKPAELAFLYDAAIKALTSAAFLSDDPETWIKAARQAAKL